MRILGSVVLVLGLAGSASAGELVFADGTRLRGELAHEMLLFSTGTGLLEVSSDQVSALSPEELRLRDGRILKGALVGGRVKARTALGELAVRVDELSVYHATEPATAPPPAASASPLGATTMTPGSERRGDPMPAAYRSTSVPSPPPGLGPNPSTVVSSAPSDGTTALPGGTAGADGQASPLAGRRVLEVVVGESALYRDAYTAAAAVGRVVKGEVVSYLDFIDRRLRVFDRVIFDGGHWVKVRAKDGVIGWLPATVLREVR